MCGDDEITRFRTSGASCKRLIANTGVNTSTSKSRKDDMMNKICLIETAQSMSTDLIEVEIPSEAPVDSDDSADTVLADSAARRPTETRDQTRDFPRPLQAILSDVLAACDESDGSHIDVPSCVMEPAELLKLNRQAPRQPVICHASLRELEPSAMQENLNLRTDICYESEISFQPVSGVKGAVKANRSKLYWKCIAIELQTYQHDLQGGCEKCSWMEHVRTETIKSRLYDMIAELRTLILMQIPESAKSMVEESIDIAWMLRLIRLGVFDMARFSTWLSKLLLTYCAPMRDDATRAMHEKIIQGAANADMTEVVQGLDALSRLLEAMRLDIGNHYLRTIKTLFIQGAVPFLQDSFGRMIREGKLDVLAVKSWFREQVQLHSFTGIDHGGGPTKRQRSKFECFVISLARLCKPGRGPMPLALAYEADRFRVLREDIQLLIDLDICVRVCNERLPRGQKLNDRQTRDLGTRILQLTMVDGTCEGLYLHEDVVAVELIKTVHSILSTNGRVERTIDIENELQEIRTKLSADRYTTHSTAKIMQQLNRQVLLDAAVFAPHSPLEISRMQARWAAGRARAAVSAGLFVVDLGDVSRRLAHIAVIVWRVWADIAFG